MQSNFLDPDPSLAERRINAHSQTLRLSDSDKMISRPKKFRKPRVPRQVKWFSLAFSLCIVIGISLLSSCSSDSPSRPTLTIGHGGRHQNAVGPAVKPFDEVLCETPETQLCPGTPGRLGKRCRGDINMIWSIGMGEGDKVFDMRFSAPVQSGEDAGRTSIFVADPFLVVEGDRWFIFSEVLNSLCQKGEIGYHVSFDDGKTWSFGQVVLREPWHLSFPFIVKHEGEHYMTTCATAGTSPPFTLWLYSTQRFPRGWRKQAEILHQGQLNGRPVDPVLHHHGGLWFLFVMDDGIQLERLFFSTSLFGPFTEHPRSQSYLVRQSGRVITDDNGEMWTFHHTGSTVARLHLQKLSRTEYQYGESIPLLGPLENSWAEAGMHTFNAVRLDSGNWAAAVDGWWNDEKRSVFLCIDKGDECKRTSKPQHQGFLQRQNVKSLSTSDLKRLRGIQFEFGFVFVQLVNSAYLEMVLNWVCHAPKGVLEQTVFFATDATTERVLSSYVPRLVPHVVLYPYESPELTYGNRNYYYFMAFRLRLLEQIVANGISIWLVESDSTWFENPRWVLHEYQDMDVLTGQDALLTDSYPEAGNMYLNASSPKALKLLVDLRKEQETSLSNLADGQVGNQGNEMLMLPRHLKKLRWSFLPRKLFVGGLWYKNSTFRESVTPIVIQNNWVVGNSAKIQRAKDWGHWFLQDGLACTETDFEL